MKKFIALLLMTFFIFACNSGKATDSLKKENLDAKAQLQGIWVDDDSDNPLIRIEGDTIYYSDPKNAPVYFKIMSDSLYMYGNSTARYKVDKQTEHIFWFHSLADNVVKLHKSEDADDSLAFSSKTVQVIPTYMEVTEKDSVLVYEGTRYHAYVYVNPSKMKVLKTSYSEEGLSMDNIYYDNVMHICVYEGRKSLFASDITKQMFKGILSDDFLDKSILSDMQFMGINRNGYQYQASVCIPESSVCNLVNITIDFKGKLTMKSVK
ncbi:DUF4738 domain-containing protein [uncultured Bacteroides sp.]|uniref:DUF4738 domain-containing protein n=1 Tax=uncultured Bacteroides sp. TaxID=162156 RepID=UPI002AA7781B|nr:DUF4738 domain-containing protein [uncultured Bacteroides sp.]